MIMIIYFNGNFKFTVNFFTGNFISLKITVNMYTLYLTLESFNVLQGPYLQFSRKAFLRTGS